MTVDSYFYNIHTMLTDDRTKFLRKHTISFMVISVQQLWPTRYVPIVEHPFVDFVSEFCSNHARRIHSTLSSDGSQCDS